MTSLFVGLYGVYFLMVGIRGNAGALIGDLSQDAPSYMPWLIAIIVIAFMSEFDATKDIVKPFAVLLLLNFLLRNFATIQKETSAIYNLSTKK